MYKKNYNNLSIKILKYLKECCIETSLHGPKYLIKNNGSWVIFLFWFCICLVALVFCIILLWLQWDAYESQPTLTTIENTHVPIYTVRFPAVTICNNNQVYLPATKNVTEKLLAQGFKNDSIHTFYSFLGNLISFEVVPHNFTAITHAIKRMGYDMSSLMLELSQPCDSLVEECDWFYGECKSRLKKIKTQNGFCCSLNYLLPASYSNETESDVNEAHLFVSGAGKKVELNFILDVETSNYVSAIKPFYGAQVLIHDGSSYPEVSIIPTIVELNVELHIVVGVQVTRSDLSVKRIPFKRRDCVFDDDTTLITTADYSYETCVTECRIRSMIRQCHCVPFYYRYDGKVRYCDFSDLPCLYRYRVMFYSVRNKHLVPHTKNMSVEDPQYMSKYGLDLEKCVCYPECEDNTYEVVAQSHPILQNTVFLPNLESEYPTDFLIENKSVVTVFYNRLTLIQYRRSLRVSWNNFLASMGGIFGLCLGGSVISIAEFLYFIALYFYKDSNRKRNKVFTTPTQFTVKPLPIIYQPVLPKNRGAK